MITQSSLVHLVKLLVGEKLKFSNEVNIMTVDTDTEEAMREIARFIENVAPGYGFSVLVFPFGDDFPVSHYISNSRREDMIKALREKADVLESGLDIPVVPGASPASQV